MLSVCIIALALCQNALDGNLQHGSGSALDGRLQVGGNGNGNGRSKQQDYRSRNLIVTGDVAGGRGFRGSVGYTAADDFRGATSGDATRVFRAESSTTTAQALASIPMSDRFGLATSIGATAYMRDFSATSPVGTTGVMRSSQTAATGAATSRVAWDRNFSAQISPAATNASRVQLDSTIRESRLSSDLLSMYKPTTLTTMFGSGQRKLSLLANPFTGISTVPTNDLVESISFGVYGSALLRADLRAGRADPQRILRSYLSGLKDARAESAGGGAMQTGSKLDTKIDGQSTSAASGSSKDSPTSDAKIRQIAEIRTPYDRVVSAVGNRYRQASGEAVALDAPIDSDALRNMGNAIQVVREQLQLNPAQPMDETERLLGAGAVGAKQNQSGEIQPTPTKTVDAESNAQSSDKSQPKNDGSTANDEESRGAKKAHRLTADEAYLLMAHGQTMEQLDGGTNEALDVMLQGAERSMRAKRYLSAEREFATAGLIAPSNPLPVAGIVNSQVAAGLQISAATSIRRLFMAWPEMIDTKYGLDILGSEARLRKIGEDSIVMSAGSKYETDYGLVAAYIGHQLGDRSLVERGIAVMDRDPNEKALATVLRVIWLRTSDVAPVLVPEISAPPAAPAAAAPLTGEERPSK